MSRLRTEHGRHYVSVQQHYNAAYQLDQHFNVSGTVDDLDHHHGGTDIATDHDDYVLVRRADYDDLVAALDNHSLNQFDVIVNAARALIDHVADDA